MKLRRIKHGANFVAHSVYSKDSSLSTYGTCCVIPRLHDRANIEQTPSKYIQIHMLIARRLLDVC